MPVFLVDINIVLQIINLSMTSFLAVFIVIYQLKFNYQKEKRKQLIELFTKIEDSIHARHNWYKSQVSSMTTFGVLKFVQTSAFYFYLKNGNQVPNNFSACTPEELNNEISSQSNKMLTMFFPNMKESQFYQIKYYKGDSIKKLIKLYSLNLTKKENETLNAHFNEVINWESDLQTKINSVYLLPLFPNTSMENETNSIVEYVINNTMDYFSGFVTQEECYTRFVDRISQATTEMSKQLLMIEIENVLEELNKIETHLVSL